MKKIFAIALTGVLATAAMVAPAAADGPMCLMIKICM
jgi:hypothetical protein